MDRLNDDLPKNVVKFPDFTGVVARPGYTNNGTNSSNSSLGEQKRVKYYGCPGTA